MTVFYYVSYMRTKPPVGFGYRTYETPCFADLLIELNNEKITPLQIIQMTEEDFKKINENIGCGRNKNQSRFDAP